MESVSIVMKRQLSELLKDDLEIVHVVRDYGPHAGVLYKGSCILPQTKSFQMMLKNRVFDVM